MASPQPSRIRCCRNCRIAHAKCDDQLPSCGRCSLLDSECVRGLPFPFKHTNNPLACEELGDSPLGQPRTGFEFGENQVWVETPTSVDFVFEYMAVETPSTECNGTIGASSSPLHLASVGHCQPASLPSGSDHSLSPAAEDSAWYPYHADTSAHGAESYNSAGPVSDSSFLSCAVATPGPQYRPPLDEREVFLLRHFVAKLSLWFDYCDPQNTFATSVAQRALSSPPLLYAILATSARHLSVTTGSSGGDDCGADEYHRQCLALLIPILNDSTAAFDEALFAATVVLRLYEEISVPFAGQDIESHLKGSHTFVRAQESVRPTSGIWHAALRVVLRQEIVIAFRTQRPVELLREYVQVDQLLDPGGVSAVDDWTCAFHIIVLCAEVLTCCYGDEAKTGGLMTWEELSGRACRWMENKPPSFEPLLHRGPDETVRGRAFPEIWLLNDCHVAAHQHYLICQILLVAHDPRKPQLGPRRDDAVEASNSVIRDHVRKVCGIALTNTHCVPSMFTASMVIAICGDLFSDDREQRAMLDILVKTDVDLAWPTASSQAYLRRKWRWDV